jgi:hypothetical protein
MASESVALSEDIVAKINEKTDYILSFEAIRRAVPFNNIEEIAQLKVVVFDGPRAAERTGRAGSTFALTRTYKPSVAVLKKRQTGGEESRLAETDQLQQLVEEIEDQLEDEDFASKVFIGFDEEQDRDPYNFDLLREQGAFVTQIVLQYQDG